MNKEDLHVLLYLTAEIRIEGDIQLLHIDLQNKKNTFETDHIAVQRSTDHVQLIIQKLYNAYNLHMKAYKKHSRPIGLHFILA